MNPPELTEEECDPQTPGHLSGNGAASVLPHLQRQTQSQVQFPKTEGGPGSDWDADAQTP